MSGGSTSLTNDVALITGAGNGIGRATALHFSKEEAKVVLMDVNEAGLNSAKEAIDSAGGEAVISTGSVASHEDVRAAIDLTLSTFSKITVLINNAGITRDGLTSRIKDGEVRLISDEKWDTVLEVNLKDTRLCCQLAAAPMFDAGHGRIVNTTSISALGNIGQANYTASKTGVFDLTKTLALNGYVTASPLTVSLLVASARA